LARVRWEDGSPGDEIQFRDDFHIVVCGGCRAVSFCKESSNSEDMEHDDYGDLRPAVLRTLYPPRIAGRSELENAYLLPSDVYSIYRETHAALCTPLPVLAGIGIRAIVETVCKEKAAPGDRLVDQIDGLTSMNLITPDGAKILHSLRVLGNKAAHQVKPHTAEELGVAFVVIENLLQSVYILPELAKKLPQPP
jgi:hypothetical protein